MRNDALDRWARSELERLDRMEKREKRDKESEERKTLRLESLINAPSMDINGDLIGGKSLSERETQ